MSIAQSRFNSTGDNPAVAASTQSHDTGVDPDTGDHRLTSDGGFMQRLFAPVPIAPLVYFRIVFGAILLWEVCRYLGYGWVDSQFLAGKFHFSYFGFDWVRPWPGRWLHDHFYVLAALAIMIAAGALFRVASILFFFAFTYVFLLDQANYLNHLYLVCLLAFLLPFLPANRAASVDTAGRPDKVLTHVPAWTLGLLKFQIAVPYFFGGIAKLNADWLRGEPLRTWMQGEYLPVVGGWPGTEPGVWVLAYGGLLFDLFIVPALMWRRTRPLALLAAAAFHLFNAVAFSIGIFPWLMLATLPLFFSVRWWERINDRWVVSASTARIAPNQPGAPISWGARQRIVAVLVLGYVAVQVLIPLRHWLYPGSVHWTEEGHRFAWHMMLRNKRGSAKFVVSHPALPQPVEVDPADWLTRRQQQKLPGHPDMILQFAHFLRSEFERRGYPGVEVRADVRVALNGRSRQQLIDPTVDLASVPRRLWPAAWIVPLREPLPNHRLPWRPPPQPAPTEPASKKPNDNET